MVKRLTFTDGTEQIKKKYQKSNFTCGTIDNDKTEIEFEKSSKNKSIVINIEKKEEKAREGRERVKWRGKSAPNSPPP